MNDKIEFVVVSTTLDSEEKAKEMAQRLIEQRLAACVQRTSIESTYRWQGAVEAEREYALAAKTRALLVDRIIEFIKENHPYDVPEVIVTPIIAGFGGYLDWVKEETG